MANVLHEPGMVTVSHDEVNEKYSLQSQSGFLFFFSDLAGTGRLL